MSTLCCGHDKLADALDYQNELNPPHQPKVPVYTSGNEIGPTFTYPSNNTENSRISFAIYKRAKSHHCIYNVSHAVAL